MAVGGPWGLSPADPLHLLSQIFVLKTDWGLGLIGIRIIPPLTPLYIIYI